MALTDKEITAAKPREKKFKLYDKDGLFLLVLPSGGRFWKMKYQRARREHELSFGTYPELSLKLARDRCDEAHKLLARGVDPVEHARNEKTKERTLFRDVSEEWLALQSKPNQKTGELPITPKSAQKYRRIVEAHLWPVLGRRRISSITTPQVTEALKICEGKGLHQTAHDALRLAVGIFSLAVATGRATANVAEPLRHRSLRVLAPVVVRHHPTITKPAEIGDLLLRIDAYEERPKVTPVVCCAFKLAPYLMLRPGELRFAQWWEFDLDGGRFKDEFPDLTGPSWIIPAARMKMRDKHIVPLSRQATQILRTLHRHTGDRRQLLPCRNLNNPEGVMSNNTLGQALTRIGYPRGTMTAHGFRSMASTRLNEMKRWDPDVIETQLAHCPRGEGEEVRSIYNYAEYLVDRTKMMQSWADYLDVLREAARTKTKAA